jgi:hypothetical protein
MTLYVYIYIRIFIMIVDNGTNGIRVYVDICKYMYYVHIYMCCFRVVSFNLTTHVP